MADLMQQARELANACEQRAQWGRGSAWNPPRDSVGTSRLLDEAASLMRELAALRAAPEGFVLVPGEVLRMMVGCAYPVSTEIDPRGYRWSEAYLDEALPHIQAAALAARPQGVK